MEAIRQTLGVLTADELAEFDRLLRVIAGRLAGGGGTMTEELAVRVER